MYHLRNRGKDPNKIKKNQSDGKAWNLTALSSEDVFDKNSV